MKKRTPFIKAITNRKGIIQTKNAKKASLALSEILATR